jgi:hypothetical protein
MRNDELEGISQINFSPAQIEIVYFYCSAQYREQAFNHQPTPIFFYLFDSL